MSDLPYGQSIADVQDLPTLASIAAQLAASVPSLKAFGDALGTYQTTTTDMQNSLEAQLARFSGAGEGQAADALADRLRHTLKSFDTVDNGPNQPVVIDVMIGYLADAIINANTEIQKMVSGPASFLITLAPLSWVLQRHYERQAQNLIRGLVTQFDDINVALAQLAQTPIPAAVPTR